MQCLYLVMISVFKVTWVFIYKVVAYIAKVSSILLEYLFIK